MLIQNSLHLKVRTTVGLITCRNVIYSIRVNQVFQLWLNGNLFFIWLITCQISPLFSTLSNIQADIQDSKVWAVLLSIFPRTLVLKLLRYTTLAYVVRRLRYKRVLGVWGNLVSVGKKCFLWYVVTLGLTVEEGCCCDDRIWSYAEPIWSQVSLCSLSVLCTVYTVIILSYFVMNLFWFLLNIPP